VEVDLANVERILRGRNNKSLSRAEENLPRAPGRATL